MTQVLLIALAGAAGTLARYGAGVGLLRFSERFAFPLGTLAVNLIGCFLIGVLHGLFAGRGLVRDDHRAIWTIGFLGGFTTFSAFGWETTTLLREGEPGKAMLNFLANNVLGLAMVIAGYALARSQTSALPPSHT